MGKFRKKPVVIEARQIVKQEPFAGFGQMDSLSDLAQWCGGAPSGDVSDGCILIPTLEGTMKASPGDWIIKGVGGEFYPCKPDIFAATYEPVE
jgi:hypothetical protein